VNLILKLTIHPENSKLVAAFARQTAGKQAKGTEEE